MIYTPREIGIVSFIAGLFVGMVIGLASCEPTPERQHVTNTGNFDTGSGTYVRTTF